MVQPLRLHEQAIVKCSNPWRRLPCRAPDPGNPRFPCNASAKLTGVHMYNLTSQMPSYRAAFVGLSVRPRSHVPRNFSTFWTHKRLFTRVADAMYISTSHPNPPRLFAAPQDDGIELAVFPRNEGQESFGSDSRHTRTARTSRSPCGPVGPAATSSRRRADQ